MTDQIQVKWCVSTRNTASVSVSQGSTQGEWSVFCLDFHFMLCLKLQICPSEFKHGLMLWNVKITCMHMMWKIQTLHIDWLLTDEAHQEAHILAAWQLSINSKLGYWVSDDLIAVSGWYESWSSVCCCRDGSMTYREQGVLDLSLQLLYIPLPYKHVLLWR